MRITTSGQVSAIITDRREQIGLTQTDLAKTIGVTRTSISRLESGFHQPSLGTLLAVLDALGMTLTVAPESNTEATHDATHTSAVPAPAVLDEIIQLAREQVDAIRVRRPTGTDPESDLGGVGQ